MPTRFHNLTQREEILKLILKNENVDPTVDFAHMAKETDGFSGSDLREMCRDAALILEQIRSINQDDMQSASQKMRKSKSAEGQSVLIHATLD
ncbi:unnamed protein product [Coregonus sp. 'balchen']|nr:unnamed protein product [Coregonus sp. 'balchen']